MRRRTINAVLATVFTAGLSGPIAAEPSAEDAFQYRQFVMTALKGHAGAISFQTRGLAGDADYIANHAEAIANLGTELNSIFQEGSNVEDSAALPEIWEEPEKFAEALAKAEEAMAALGAAASDNNLEAIGRAFHNVGEACKGCHERYREEHEH